MSLTFRLMLCVSAFLSSLHLFAQDISISVSVLPGDEAEGMKVFVSSLTPGSELGAQECKKDGAKFTITLPASSTGFYNLTVVKNNAQIINPVYFPSGTSAVDIDVKYSDNMIAVGGTSDNKALNAYNNLLVVKSTELWEGKVAAGDLKAHVKSYLTAADSLADAYACSPSVKKYLEINGYTSAYSAYSMIPRALGMEPGEVGFALNDVLENPNTVLDDAISSVFFSATYIIMNSLPKGTLCEQLGSVYADYNDASLRNVLSSCLMERFISGFDADADYDGGLAQVQEAVSKYGADEKYISLYSKRRNGMVGSLFPAGVILEDAEGNKVDFSSFKGKYVYIDMWASWCGPCVREIPHLKKLEAELQNKDVIFVSISIDRDKEAWKKKMAALNLHGHQLLDAEGRLGEMLNIQGIPHFLIYDKEGRLHTYKAMRPSSGEKLKEQLENLK